MVDRHAWAIDRLELASARRVLEIGFGPGRALRMLLDREPALDVYGLDRSASALRRAETWRAAVDGGDQLHLSLGELDELSAAAGSFDRILAINVNALWRQPRSAFPPVLSALAPGGLCLVAFEAPSMPRADEIAARLEAAGRTMPGVHLTVERHPASPLVAARILGTVPHGAGDAR